MYFCFIIVTWSQWSSNAASTARACALRSYRTSPLPKSARPSTSTSLSLAFRAFSVTSADLPLDWPAINIRNKFLYYLDRIRIRELDSLKKTFGFQIEWSETSNTDNSNDTFSDISEFLKFKLAYICN